MDYSGFQALLHTCHGNVLSEPLFNNGLFQLSGVMSQYEDKRKEVTGGWRKWHKEDL
jgi:hypothetical protein